MRIDASEEIAGVSMIAVRKLLQRGYCGVFRREFVEHHLGLCQTDALRLIGELVERGFVERSTQKHSGADCWEVTEAGARLRMATAAKPLRRASCDKIVQKFLQRVGTVNDDAHYLYRVQEAILFGSYARGDERPNDIDVFVDLQRKHEDNDRHKELVDERSRAAAAEKPHRFQRIGDWDHWPQNEVLLFLKSRSRALSIHTGFDREIAEQDDARRTIFPPPASTESESN